MAGITRGTHDELTARAVDRQLRAMGAERYDIGLIHQVTDRPIPRLYTHEQALRAVGWLRARNAEGYNVYVRPLADEGTNVGLVLVDDLSAERIGQMRRDGFGPAAVTETSPGNYQAWVRLADRPLAADLATAAARELTQRYGGDPASADYKHYGRLAGFTNRKQERARGDGLQPFVKLHESGGRRAARANELLDVAAERLRARERQAEERRAEDARLQARAGGPQDPARADDFSRPGQGGALIDGSRLAAEYRQHAERLIARYPLADMSRLDYTVLRDLAKRHPHANTHDLSEALRQGSPNVHDRKTNDRWLDRYVEKTVTAVNLDPHVREARHEHERQRGGRRGR